MTRVMNNEAKNGHSPASDIEAAVLSRYARGAEQVEPALCCPTDYDAQYLKLIPQEILEKDYGCGDPSRHVGEGETVVDLGSGAGKICYILAQKVGPKGKVIGLDFNDAMLELARKYQDEMAEKLGYANVSFQKARIQDMALDLVAAQHRLAEQPITGVEQLAAFEAHCQHLRREQPLIADDSIDAIVSNCVLNLVQTEQKRKLFAEMFRVLKRGGRAVISDIVCDEEPTDAIMNDPDLWSGCIAGAFREDRFLAMFEEAGLHGIEILSRGEQPWQTIQGIEFRSMTVRAYKGKQGPCLERNQAVVYRGPWKQVRDDDGHTLHRGQRMAVCDKTYRLMTNPSGPCAGQIIGIEPREQIPPEEAKPFNCHGSTLRRPRQTKGEDYDATQINEQDCCDPDSGCC
ncbi:MAG: methyltransferase domain-containing protein [Phycisphaeraceae bacterium]